MNEQSNDKKYRDSIQEFSHGAGTKEIGICSWCKDQVHPDKAADHASNCALVPEEEREKILHSKDKVVQSLTFDERKNK